MYYSRNWSKFIEAFCCGVNWDSSLTHSGSAENVVNEYVTHKLIFHIFKVVCECRMFCYRIGRQESLREGMTALWGLRCDSLSPFEKRKIYLMVSICAATMSSVKYYKLKSITAILRNCWLWSSSRDIGGCVWERHLYPHCFSSAATPRSGG